MESGATSELSALKTKLRATWSAGDFGQIAKYYANDAADFIKRLELKPGMTVLDVACGTGNLAIPAARTGAIVTGVDIAPNSVEQARQNAKAEGLNARFDEGDAEELPYDDASFDAVVTMFGGDVCATSGARGERVEASLPSGWCHRDGQLDAGRFHWPDVQDHVVACSAAAGNGAASALGGGRNRS
jgi:SAM-dependent methyltransferase